MTKYFDIRFEPRWPAFAFGFYRRRKFSNYTFTIVLWFFVVEIGDRA